MTPREVAHERVRHVAFVVCGGVCLLTAAFAIALLTNGSGSVQAQAANVVGYTGCGGNECHTKSGEIDWLTQKDGGKEHLQSLARLRNSRDTSIKYAKAVGLENPEDPNGMCLKCHGTFVVKAKSPQGVGCEGCHGAATGYREYHSQTPKDYAGAVAKGLRDLDGKPNRWIAVCRDCHVLDGRAEYEKLIEEGHKDGAKWNVAKKYPNVQTHWKKPTGMVTYTEAQIASAAKGNVVVAAPPPVPTAPPATTPAPVPSPAPTPSPTPNLPPGPVRAGAVPGPPSTTEKGPTAKAGPAPGPAAGGGRVTPPVTNPATVPGPTAAPPAAPTTAPPPAPPAPAVPTEIVSPLSIAPPPPVSPTGLFAALQDRVESLLTSLLLRNSTPPAPLKPPPPAPAIAGPDGELLRLQYEAMKLAVEALNLKPKK